MEPKISRGALAAAVKAVIYGPEGIGKTSLAAGLPDPVFIDAEGGTTRFDVARIEVENAGELNAALTYLTAGKHGFKTVVVDTADWAERLLAEALIAEAKKSNVKSIEDFGYGKGYTMLAEKFGNFLAQLDQILRAGIHVVVLAHAKVTRVSPPDMADGYDKWELKLTKLSSPLLKEWAETILFANFGIRIEEGADGKKKGVGGKERFLYATPSAAYDAKNRFGLDDCLYLAPESIAHIFATPTPTHTSASAPSAPPRENQVAPAAAPLAKANDLHALFIKLNMPEGDTRKKAAAWASANRTDNYRNLTEPEADKLISELQKRLAAKPAQKPQPELPAQPAPAKTEPADDIPMYYPKDLEFIPDAERAAALAYLVGKKWLTAGQTFENLTSDQIGKIVANKDGFLRAVHAGVVAK